MGFRQIGCHMGEVTGKPAGSIGDDLLVVGAGSTVQRDTEGDQGAESLLLFELVTSGANHESDHGPAVVVLDSVQYRPKLDVCPQDGRF